MEIKKEGTLDELNDVLENINPSTPENEGMKEEDNKTQTEPQNNEPPTNEQGQTESSTPEENNNPEGDEAKVLEEFPAKVNGKEGVVKRYKDKVVFEVNGRPVREFKDMTELIQKGLASDEKFQQAALLRKQYEAKLQEINAEKQRLMEEVKNTITEINKDDISVDDIKRLAKENGIELSDEDLDNLELGDTKGVIGAIIQKLSNKVKEKEKELLQKEQEVQQQLFTMQMQDYLDSEPVRLLDEVSPETMKVGTSFVIGLTQAIIQQAQNNQIEVDASKLPEVMKMAVETVQNTLDKVVERKLPEVLSDKERAKGLLDSIMKAHPDLIQEIKEAAVKEHLEAMKKGNIMASPQGTGVTESVPSNVPPEKLGTIDELDII